MRVVEPTTVEALPERDLTSTAVLTTTLVLAAATMTFGAIIAVFFIRSQGKLWGHLDLPVTLWVTTAVLAISSYTLERSRRFLEANEQLAAHKQFIATAALALIFLVGQIVAWIEVLHSGISLKNNSHSWFVFLFVALHGLHILLGLGAISVLAYRTREQVGGRRYQAQSRALCLGTSIFWHYLGFLWLVLFALLLFWKR